MTENGKVEKFECEIILFPEFTGNRTETDKRFPDGRIRLSVPVPTAEYSEADRDFFSQKFNLNLDTLSEKGMKQYLYAEQAWDTLKYEGEKPSDVTPETQIQRIEAKLGSMDNLDEFMEKAREFFEDAVFMEVKERKTSETKAKAKKYAELEARLGKDALEKLTPEKLAKIAEMLEE